MADTKRTKSKSEREHKHKRKHRSDKEGSSKKARKEDGEHIHILDESANDDDMWEEKNIDMDGEKPLATTIPTAESLKLTSRAEVKPDDPPLPAPVRAETTLQRDEWMLMPPSTPEVASRKPDIDDAPLTEGYGESSQNARKVAGNLDFFSSLGTEHKKKPQPDRPDPDKPYISHRELNTALKEGKSIDEMPTATPKASTPGGPGSQWRMMKLRRVYEQADEEGKAVEEVALERFESFEAFHEAQEERRVLDEREGRRASRGGSTDRRDKGKRRMGKDEYAPGETRLMFTDVGGSAMSGRSTSFRRPDLGAGSAGPATPTPETRTNQGKYDTLRLSSQGTPSTLSHTPIPSVMTPSASLAASLTGSGRALSPSSLNRLQAKVLRAKLIGASEAESLEKQYEEELRKANGSGERDGVRTKVEVLPTLDIRGNLYDVGQGKEDAPMPSGNRKKREQQFESHDRKTGEQIRINADDDSITLGEMLRQERMRNGPADQKNMDMEYAKQIMTDSGFKADNDYMDDNAEKLGRKKMRSDAMKRQFAINDYKRTQKVLSTCPFCFGENDEMPKAPIIAMGTRVYLSCTLTEELVDGHCLIVPIQHHLTMLEGDDDVWDEVRNFMKCLMRMYAEEDKGVIFYETVINIKWQKHTCIECVPLPWEHFEQIPGYFKESILMSEAEWSQHKKLIDFSARPGGFRRAMVPNLPYFMVQFDYKGEKGYGHVIEGTGDAGVTGDVGDEDLDDGEKGGGEFPRYFAGEIVGNLLDLEPRIWRHPRRVDSYQNKQRVAKFKQKYDKYDWTGMIGRS
ncbi:CwfJ C-terminus 1-domain-containing protein-like protein [Fomitopsis serialis]|uniref:CwfJ C-terminus 1-domain-containing protein-like protein n=1 Tax=Fomitopsis serialis TaxID=139415 RepID=UPI0020089A93|nr:CwfJ C-terminus 1-domain-containing protein-like protein [Neoantrodia serialis]KAH9936259.1 CwfJ C-terminus 1-domain-containing protein-like protein [Neoantrodia serialis]